MLPSSPCQDFLSVLWSRPRHKEFAKLQHSACRYWAQRFPIKLWEKCPDIQPPWYSQLFSLDDSWSHPGPANRSVYRTHPSPAKHPDLGNSHDFQGKPYELSFFEPCEVWQQFQQSGQGDLCVRALQSWGAASWGSWAPAESQSCRAPLAALAFGLFGLSRHQCAWGFSSIWGVEITKHDFWNYFLCSQNDVFIKIEEKKVLQQIKSEFLFFTFLFYPISLKTFNVLGTVWFLSLS